MYTTLIKPLIITFTLLLTTGVLVHDTQIDRAAKTALALPGALASVVAIDNLFRTSEYHVHVERASAPRHYSALHSSVPRIQPRDDDRRHIAKKLYYSGGGSNYIWPSV